MNPDDFMGNAAAAVAVKSLYDAYVAAGFTSDQAMQILCALVSGSVTRR